MYILYTRPNCHLCQEAKEAFIEYLSDVTHKDMVNNAKTNWKEINIDESDELIEKYGLMIPVLVKDGEIVCYGKVTVDLLKEVLD